MDPSRLRAVVSQYPEEPAVRLRLAVQLLLDSGGLNREEEWGAHRRGFFPKERSAEEKANLDEAIEHLRRASALAPENSAPDFLLAYALFAKQEDSEAEKALRTALAKPGWSVYTDEINQAMLTLHEESGVPGVFLSLSVLNVDTRQRIPLFSKSRSIARLLTGLGEKSRAAGDHERAVFYYECSTHLGRVILDGAEFSYDGLVASSIFAITGGPFISKAEAEALKSFHLPKEQERYWRIETYSRNFRAYLVAWGREDLSDAYTRDSERTRRFKEDAVAVSRRMMPRIHGALGSRSMQFAAMSWLLLLYVFALLIITGFLSLISRSWKKQGTAPLWHRWEWAVLMAAAFAPIYVVGILFFSTDEGQLISPTSQGYEVISAVAAIIAIGAPLLLIVIPIVGGLRKRRRQPAEERLDRLQACLASFRALLPATFALLLLVSLALTIPGQLRIQRWVEVEKKIIQQGEVEYWNIGGDSQPALADDVTLSGEKRLSEGE
ncbi:MAG: tetratricopeptide repeat protein [Armatimonadetes bacterium]|nr:tetratricopeptide repeat protein [Armatimonadota bacterium]NIM23037.1 tetratricopeptide repeat protein [Armatimonadota bacterium]NIM66905.1 tetratricopeptide repeat protein [Armatimonadota bacterium]NIM75439.1 tetratricopeptide repeat protein [Armatimonadota bacterium]NIN05096.1 tetratricopeptide repeat protein [Armatimonadota bacterium]